MGDVGKHTSVTSFSSERHQGMFVELTGFVIRSFENGCASHRGLGGSDDGKVLA